jgi:NADH-quinone oxidoreductase subunit M
VPCSLCIGVLYDRVHSREISSYGGVVNTMPTFAPLLLLFFAMANCGLPGTGWFCGRVDGDSRHGVGQLCGWALLAAIGFGVWCRLQLVDGQTRVYFGPVANDDVKGLTDINAREFTVMALLAIAVLYMGLYPKPFTDVMEVSVANLLQHVAVSKLP